MDQAFKKLIINAFEDTFLHTLSDEVAGYNNCTSLQFITHVFTYYAIIAPTELMHSYEWPNTPHDPNQLIEILFHQMKYEQAFAIAGGQPYENAIPVNLAFTLVFNTGLLPDACRA
jgi:hypothetical protein